MSNIFGILAVFETPREIYEAAKKVRDAGFRKWDVYSPFPIHGMDSAMGLKRSKVPIISFIGGFIGFWAGMAMSWYMGDFDYALIVGGKPYFSPIFTFPIAYELTILLASFGAFFGMFLTNFLPQHYHPVMHFKDFRRLTDDRFAIVIEKTDSLFDDAKTQSFLEEIGGKTTVVLPD